MTNNQTPRTFWELLNTHPVKIPKIQRDYVQGRTIRQVVSAQEMLFDDIESALYSEKNSTSILSMGRLMATGISCPLMGSNG